MQIEAGYRILDCQETAKVICTWSNPEPVIVHCPKPVGKYHKVGKESKMALIAMVESGMPIIKASRELGINYSTAKSIVQFEKAANKKTHNSSLEETDPSDAEIRVPI